MLDLSEFQSRQTLRLQVRVLWLQLAMNLDSETKVHYVQKVLLYNTIDQKDD